MSDVITATDAAHAALAAAAGGPAVAVVAVVAAESGAVQRILVHDDGTFRGTVQDVQLLPVALRLALRALHAPTEPIVEAVELGGHAWLVYAEAHRPPDHLVIVGAGHIAVPLAHVGRMLDFRVTVLDDREEFATTARFDDDVVVLRTDFTADPFAGVTLAANSWVALVTRGHKWDFDCLRRILAMPVRPHYIGMIGSRRRVRAAYVALLEAGVPRDVLAGIRAPIGLEIQAETPAEIAIAIAAELVAVRRGADVASISTRERVLDRFLQEPAR